MVNADRRKDAFPKPKPAKIKSAGAAQSPMLGAAMFAKVRPTPVHSLEMP